MWEHTRKVSVSKKPLIHSSLSEGLAKLAGEKDFAKGQSPFLPTMP
jgi:hypothetical protein